VEPTGKSEGPDTITQEILDEISALALRFLFFFSLDNN